MRASVTAVVASAVLLPGSSAVRTRAIGAARNRSVMPTKIKLTAAAVVASAVLLQPGSSLAADSLREVSPAQVTYAAEVDFTEFDRAGAGDVTALVTAVDLRVPNPLDHGSTSGCEAADFIGFPQGHVALLQRGWCEFRTKAQNALAAGAVGAIVFNSGSPGHEGLTGVTLDDIDTGGTDPRVPLPAVFTTFALGDHLRNGVLNGPTGVTVQLVTDGDAVAPDLALPGTITVPATSPAGAVVAFTVTATDDVDPSPAVTCNPPSGSSFPVGTTPVQCRAADTSGNASDGEFDVVVIGAQAQLSDLSAAVSGADMPQAIKESLSSKLAAAARAAERGNTAAACSQLSAFTSEVQAHAGKKISASLAADLLNAAGTLRGALGC